MQTLAREPATPDPNLLAVQLYPVCTMLGILGASELPAMFGGQAGPAWLAQMAGCLGLGVALHLEDLWLDVDQTSRSPVTAHSSKATDNIEPDQE